jgi:alkylation response protein AidB-like acyl-CoA dehydrogenase
MVNLVDRRHLTFVLDEVLDAPALLELPRFSHVDREAASAMLDAAERLARDHFAPTFSHLDANEPRIENGRVVLPGEIASALAALREGGFFAATANPEDGGVGLPRSYANAALLLLQAANVSIANYAFLTMSAAELLAQHGTPEQKARYMVPMLEGRFFGTMALSEPHAGSSLGDIRTVAYPLPDGRYALRGTKMWISGGEHDMGENIVHLMLARIEGAPAGTRGISLFIVPRKRLDSEGRPTEWNHIALSGLNHKMGQRGTVNTILNVGEDGDTIGEIVGGPGQGLACMFTMMNEARIAVSMGAVAHANAGYQHALAYARERVQGRHPDSKDPASPPVPIVAHADVRRMLLQQKAAAEGGLALGLYVSGLADMKAGAEDASDRADAALLLDFLTPIFKGWISEEMLRASDAAIQVLGGAGYTRDHPLEQHYRDNRLNPIHEGTNGIQAIDMLGRKVMIEDGRALDLFLARVRHAALAASQSSGEVAELATQLAAVADLAEGTTADLKAMRETHGPRHYLANATHYLDLVGLVAFAWIWLEQARVAAAALATAEASEADFYRGKIATCRYVFSHRLPFATQLAGLLSRGDSTYLDFKDQWL